MASNSPQLDERIDRDNVDIFGHEGNEATSKIDVLELEWDTNCDTLPFNVKDTSRLVTSNLQFDHIGILLPVTTRARLFMQELWHLRVIWDEPLGRGLAEKWRDLWSDMTKSQTVDVDRNYLRGSVNLSTFNMLGSSHCNPCEGVSLNNQLKQNYLI